MKRHVRKCSKGTNKQWVEKELLLIVKAGITTRHVNQLLKTIPARARKEFKGMNVYHVILPSYVDELEAIDKLKANEWVVDAELNEVNEANYTPNDPNLGSAWQLSNINCEDAWDIATGVGTVVAICDSGIRTTHEEFVGKIHPDSWNIAYNSSNISYGHLHGTAVAGMAAASGDNGKGACGVAFNAEVMVLRITTNNNASATQENIISAIQYAAEHGADVANVSYNSVASSYSCRVAAVAAASKGTIVTTGVGNNNERMYGESSIGMIVAAGNNSSNQRYSSTSFGSIVDITAPAQSVYTTGTGSDSAYGTGSGNSYAAPTVAGVVCLMRETFPEITPTQLKSTIISTSRAIDDPNPEDYGGGIIDAYAAVSAAEALKVNSTPPSVEIISPINNSTKSGLVLIEVDAISEVGIGDVKLYIDNYYVGVDLLSPYEFTIDTADYPDGVHTIKAVATSQNSYSKSDSISVTFSNGNPADTEVPEVTLTATFEDKDDNVSGMQGISATAQDKHGVVRMKLRVNGEAVIEVDGDTISWDWYTDTFPNGDYEISVTAYDAAGNYATEAIECTVDNGTKKGILLPLLKRNKQPVGTIVEGLLAVVSPIADGEVSTTHTHIANVSILAGELYVNTKDNYAEDDEVLLTLIDIGRVPLEDRLLTTRVTIHELQE